MFKKILFVAVSCLCLSLIQGHAFAQSEDVAKSPEAQELRNQFNALGKAFDVEVPDQKVEAPQPAPKKTMADVADKALDMVTDISAKLSETLRNVAPEVWRIMLRQQYAKALSSPLLPIGLLIVGLVYLAVIKKKIPDDWKESSNGDESFTFWVFRVIIPYLANLGFGIWTVATVYISMRILINPEFYAIHDLISMILKSGT